MFESHLIGPVGRIVGRGPWKKPKGRRWKGTHEKRWVSHSPGGSPLRGVYKKIRHPPALIPANSTRCVWLQLDIDILPPICVSVVYKQTVHVYMSTYMYETMWWKKVVDILCVYV